MSDKAVCCQLYETREITKHHLIVEERFKTSNAAINHKMGIATFASNTVIPREIVQTKFGSSPVRSTDSYQLSYTETNLPVYVRISSIPRCPDSSFDINSYPRFPLKNTERRLYPDNLTGEEKNIFTCT